MNRLAIVAAACITLAGCAHQPLRPATDPRRPVALSTSLERYGGPSIKLVLLPDGTLRHSVNENDWLEASGTVVRKVTVTAAKWQQFRRDLDAAQVWSWKDDYPHPPGTSEGVIWKVHLAYPDRSITTQGEQTTPPPEQFRAYEAAVKKLIGNLPFE